MAWPDTPPAAGRTWVPGCRASGRSSGPWHLSTTKGPRIQDPRCDQFVISIGGLVRIQFTIGSGYTKHTAWFLSPMLRGAR